MGKQPELDYKQLTELLKNKEAKTNDKLSVDDVRSRMHKVAFDVYSIENDPYDALWKLESNASDGKEYLVRMDGEGTSAETKTAGWTAASNDSGTSITLAYNNVPVQRLAGNIFGFSKNDVGLFKKALLEKVSKDELFRSKILDMQSDERKSELVKAFPELIVYQK
jgi:hypothetical protein